MTKPVSVGSTFECGFFFCFLTNPRFLSSFSPSNSQGSHQCRTPRAIHFGRRRFAEHGALQVQTVLQRTEPRCFGGWSRGTATEHLRTDHKGRFHRPWSCLPMNQCCDNCIRHFLEIGTCVVFKTCFSFKSIFNLRIIDLLQINGLQGFFLLFSKMIVLCSFSPSTRIRDFSWFNKKMF